MLVFYSEPRVTAGASRQTAVVCAPCPETLDDALDRLAEPSAPLALTTACGIEYRFPRAELIPRRTVSCLCGSPGCYLTVAGPWPPEE